MCHGGVDLNPHVFTCGYSGLIFGLLSMKSMIIVIAGIAILYYAWPTVEKILIALPIPDPKSIKEKISGMVNSKGGKGGKGKKEYE